MDDTKKEEQGIVGTLLGKTEEKSNTFLIDFVDMQPLEKDDPTTKNLAPLEKAWIGVLGPKGSPERLAFEVDPSIARYGFVYRPKLQGIPDDYLKRVAIQDDLVAHIIQCRCHQMMPFGSPRKDRFSLGFEIKPNAGVEDDLTPDQHKELKRRISDAVKLFQNCGSNENVLNRDRCTLTQWLIESVRNALIVGRIATERVYTTVNGERKFAYFRSIDAGTIYKANRYQNKDSLDSVREMGLRLLSELKNEKLTVEKFNNGEYEWVQVVKGTPRQGFTQEQCVVKNFYPANDIELDGYPITPLDTIVSAVITHISIVQQNKMWFQTGRAARGMMLVKGENVNQAVLNGIKQQFWASINGVQNCLDGSSQISTKEAGGISVEEYLKGAKEKNATVWTGTSWEKGLVYRTGKKVLAETRLSNGVVNKTSPDHRFRVIVDGKPAWKRQSELQIGDYVFVNKLGVEDGKTHHFNGKAINEDLMEVFGWLTGDGSIGKRGLRFFYHLDKEPQIRDRHFKILTDFGFPAKLIDKEVPLEDQEKIISRYGFKTTKNKRISIDVNSRKTLKELLEMGFSLSKRGCDSTGKAIPPFVFTLPEGLKAAFLRGLFSADGNIEGGRNVKLTCANHHLRGQVRQLLLNMGIRTDLTEGRQKTGFGKSELCPHFLLVKDRDAFFSKIGFLQAHKQPKPLKNPNRAATKDRLPQDIARYYVQEVKNTDRVEGSYRLKGDLTTREHLDLNEIIRDHAVLSRTRLERLCNQTGVKLPKWITDYHFEQVVDTRNTGELVEMYDVAVFPDGHKCSGFDCEDDSHAIMVNDALQHNSHRMPIFSVPMEGEISWVPIDNSSRDAEFQYLTDMNARVILSAFQISPDELPGWAYLSRGTASQGLSESNLEYKLEAARDLGIRPLIAKLEEFINTHLFPLIDEGLSRVCKFQMAGLEAETPEKESVRFQQDIPIHGDYDWLMEKVEKPRVGKDMGGKFPLNPQFQSVLDKYLPVGIIKEAFFGIKGASKDPNLQYYRDPFWFNNQQLIQSQQQAAQQGGPPGGGDGSDQGGPGGGPQMSQEPGTDTSGSDSSPSDDGRSDKQVAANDKQAQAAETADAAGADLSRSIDQAIDLLSKGEEKLPPSKRRLLQQHRKVVDQALEGWEAELKEATKAIVRTATAGKAQK